MVPAWTDVDPCPRDDPRPNSRVTYVLPRLEIQEIMRGFFCTVISLTPEDLVVCVYLACNEVRASMASACVAWVCLESSTPREASTGLVGPITLVLPATNDLASGMIPCPPQSGEKRRLKLPCACRVVHIRPRCDPGSIDRSSHATDHLSLCLADFRPSRGGGGRLSPPFLPLSRALP